MIGTFARLVLRPGDTPGAAWDLMTPGPPST
jgi:hypothetical protein